MVLRPASELAAEHGFDLRMEAVETGFQFVGLGGKKHDGNGAVPEGAGKITNTRKHSGGKSFEGANSIALALATVGTGAAIVTSVQESAQFIGLSEVGIDFVQKQGRLVLVDEAKEHRRSEAFSA